MANTVAPIPESSPRAKHLAPTCIACGRHAVVDGACVRCGARNPGPEQAECGTCGGEGKLLDCAHDGAACPCGGPYVVCDDCDGTGVLLHCRACGEADPGVSHRDGLHPECAADAERDDARAHERSHGPGVL